MRYSKFIHADSRMSGGPWSCAIKGGCIMKKVIMFVTAVLILFSSLVYAGGDKVRGSKGQGSTGTTGGKATTQTRGK